MTNRKSKWLATVLRLNGRFQFQHTLSNIEQGSRRRP